LTLTSGSTVVGNCWPRYSSAAGVVIVITTGIGAPNLNSRRKIPTSTVRTPHRTRAAWAAMRARWRRLRAALQRLWPNLHGVANTRP